MTLNNKQKKKLTHKLMSIEDKLSMIINTLITGLFILFCVVLLFDQLATKIFFPYIKIAGGIGFGQLIVASAILGVMWWLNKVR